MWRSSGSSVPSPQASHPASTRPSSIASPWRNLGPFRTGAWTTAIARPGDARSTAHLYTFYVGTRNGGVWKTTNNGTTFEPVFDAQPSLSIGAIDVAPSDANIVWVGTGEAYQARSSYSGDGVYKSTDAGKTWTNMGLRDSHHISRIVIHPKNPNIVYVAAMGHLFSPNEERGLFMTEDGGKTWKKSLFVDEKTGVIDLVMSRKDPNVLYAATYELTRLPWDLDIGGPGSGIWKTTDGGKKWTRLGGGLPGRPSRPHRHRPLPGEPAILYAIVENANLRPPTEQEAKRDDGRPEAQRVRRRQRGLSLGRWREDVEDDPRPEDSASAARPPIRSTSCASIPGTRTTSPSSRIRCRTRATAARRGRAHRGRRRACS